MTLENFSSGFDVLANSFASVSPFGKENGIADVRFTEYEKSLFLTDAQEVVALDLYNGKNPFGESFEQTEEMRRYLAPLIAEAELKPIESTERILGMDSKSKFFTLPDGKGEKPAVWFLTYETIILSDNKDKEGNYINGCMHGKAIAVYPTKQDEYNKIKKNPFRGINKRRALRLDLSDNVVEVKSAYEDYTYYIRYLKKLKPIVLEDFSLEEVSINGVNIPTPCELHEGLHQKVLDLAVALALKSRGIIDKNENK